MSCIAGRSSISAGPGSSCCRRPGPSWNYGEWLRRENRAGQRRAQLGAAHQAFEAMESRGFAERARREFLAAGGTVRKRSWDTQEDLTPQEAQIARLAADGRSLECGDRHGTVSQRPYRRMAPSQGVPEARNCLAPGAEEHPSFNSPGPVSEHLSNIPVGRQQWHGRDPADHRVMVNEAQTRTGGVAMRTRIQPVVLDAEIRAPSGGLGRAGSTSTPTFSCGSRTGLLPSRDR